MRISVLNRDRCQPKRCAHECHRFCPRVRTGDETIVIGEDHKPIISEELCVGCGICTKKCPFDAIMIIGLPEELREQETHRYGVNGFALYGLPIPQEGKVTGILGPNGTGKSTAIKILSGSLKPNIGKDAPHWDEIIQHYRGSELQGYMRGISQKEIRIAQKPQHIDAILKAFSGSARELLQPLDERGALKDLTSKLDIDHILDRGIEDLSGGELQRVAIAACMAKDANFYFFDEITSHLDICQRIEVAKLIQDLSKNKTVMIVEHDLAILDLLADIVHIVYGTPGGYGVITSPKGVRVGINQYLQGFLPEENIRMRQEAIKFEVHAPRLQKDIPALAKFDAFVKKYPEFTLNVKGGEIRRGEVIGIVGPNGIGKSTFIKVLAGIIEPDEGAVGLDLQISYKPQYITRCDESVRDLLRTITKQFGTSHYNTEVIGPLQLEYLLDQNLTDLSGGELQRVAIAACLSRKADLYILDEPSAHLDVEQRTSAIKTIRRFAENNKASAMVVDHDIYMIDLLSERLMVFDGKPGVCGEVFGPFDMREGMNKFLEKMDITFRRDENTKRPRVNKPESKLDREQKAKGEYYYQ
ncbi:MAG: ribosome biogenesis/translation initiation ATPase RLI [Methanosarcinales archaeon Met12]|nr:MAG: ribosome biogenesis/translation initiation ATPase RLI [Methanosarcinales archaeon Met12]